MNTSILYNILGFILLAMASIMLWADDTGDVLVYVRFYGLVVAGMLHINTAAILAAIEER